LAGKAEYCFGLFLLSLCLRFEVQGLFVGIFRNRGVYRMDSRIALVGIIVEDPKSVDRINETLHEYRNYIIGRMGIPYRKRSIAVISIVMDAPNPVISALSGKLGMLPNVSTKTIYSKITPSSKDNEH
jgi:putative iron-only hydrogenase system regulator